MDVTWFCYRNDDWIYVMSGLSTYGDHELAEELRDRGFSVGDPDYLEDYSDAELIDELDSRGITAIVDDHYELLTSIWLKRRLGQDYQVELDTLIYRTIGKVI